MCQTDISNEIAMAISPQPIYKQITLSHVLGGMDSDGGHSAPFVLGLVAKLLIPYHKRLIGDHGLFLQSVS